MKSNQKGISLLEVSLSIGIATIILLLAVYLFKETQSDTQVTKSVTLLQKISRASYEWLQAQNQLDFCNSKTDPPKSLADCQNPVSLSNTRNTGLIDNDLITPFDTCSSSSGSTKCLLTPWGTQITVEPAVSSGSATTSSGAQYIRVGLPGVPNKTICLQIRDDMLSITPTGIQSDCTADGTGKINYYVEL